MPRSWVRFQRKACKCVNWMQWIFFLLFSRFYTHKKKILLLHQNPVKHLFRAVLDCFGAYFSPDSDNITNFGLWCFTWKQRFEVKSVSMMMLTDGLEWCGLLWCVYQLFGLSFWRHPFTTDDPLVSKWCNATLLQIWWRNKLIYVFERLKGEYILILG